MAAGLAGQKASGGANAPHIAPVVFLLLSARRSVLQCSVEQDLYELIEGDALSAGSIRKEAHLCKTWESIYF